MIENVGDYIKRNNLLIPHTTVIIGLSGGADSIALTDILIKLGYNCIAAHCNFSLRGEESDSDADFVHNWCESRHLPLEMIRFNTIEHASHNKISIEMAARELRYEWFEKLRKKHAASAIAVAHHKNDSVETVLMNLIRGTGISGLTGIASKNGYIVRPLINITREEIEKYLEAEKLDFRTDSTNLQDLYTRNRIRINILPEMIRINPSVIDAINKTTDYLSSVEKIYRDYIAEEKNRIKKDNRLSIDALQKSQHSAAVLYEILTQYNFSASTIQDIYNNLNATSGKIFFSHTHRIIKDRSFLLLDRLEDIISEQTSFHIYASEEILEEPLKLKLSIHSVPINIEPASHILYADYDKLHFPLQLRKWQHGDWFIPFGMKGKKKLSDYFSDQKFSIKEKEEVWLLTSSEKIVWVVGKRSDNRFRVDDTTKNVLVVEILPEEE